MNTNISLMTKRTEYVNEQMDKCHCFNITFRAFWLRADLCYILQ